MEVARQIGLKVQKRCINTLVIGRISLKTRNICVFKYSGDRIWQPLLVSSQPILEFLFIIACLLCHACHNWRYSIQIYPMHYYYYITIPGDSGILFNTIPFYSWFILYSGGGKLNLNHPHFLDRWGAWVLKSGQVIAGAGICFISAFFLV